MEPAASKIWFAPERNPRAEKRLEEALGVSPLVAACLVARGIEDPDEADAFLNPKLDELHDPLLLPDANVAVREIMGAKERDELIYIHGDYDVDGVASTAIWTRSLRKLGFKVAPHVPHRMKEGYGIHKSAIQEAVQMGAKLLLTCDCGSSAIETIAAAREAGMRVVVTDHHQLGDEVPQVEALVNPHRSDSTYPFAELCGAAVAFKMAQAVSQECGVSKEAFYRAYLDLVCLGTIADIVPLVDENRILAHHGLKALGESKKVGLQALMSISKVDTSHVTSVDVGFRLGPRLNAAGRVDDAEHAFQLLLTDDLQEATEKSKLLDEHNRARQTEEKRILQQAEELIIENRLHDNPLILVVAPEWHKGVVGIVASRIVERFYRPTLVGSINDETGYVGGSARSIPGFHLNQALQAHKELFTSCGGHEMAAGFSFPTERLDEIQSKLIAYAGSVLQPEDLIAKELADATISPQELSFKTVKELQKLEPFGAANPQPRFIIRNCPLETIKPTSNPEHIQFSIKGEAGIIKGIGFRSSHLFDGLTAGEPVDILAVANIEKWNGSYSAKLMLEDLQRPA